MGREHGRNRGAQGATAMKVACALAFVCFSFVFLRFEKACLLQATQHVLSGGQTTYNPTIGALVITLLLWLVQMGAYALTRLERRFHAITFFPSMLLLTIMTSVSPAIDPDSKADVWLWLGPLLIVLWYGLARLLRNLQTYEPRWGDRGVLSRVMWVNLVVMAFMAMAVGLVSAASDVLTYRLEAEVRLARGDTEGALRVGERSLVADSSLTMIRCYALAREGRLGEKLFTYPVGGTSEDMVPVKGGTRLLYYPADSIYRFLGAIPRDGMSVGQYLSSITRHGQATEAVGDYVLCACLIDRDLDAFVAHLPNYYPVNDSLPRHYKEALTLYNHLRANPAIIYKNSVLETDFADLQRLEAESKTDEERRLKVFDQYRGSYWWYYEYCL